MFVFGKRYLCDLVSISFVSSDKMFVWFSVSTKTISNNFYFFYEQIRVYFLDFAERSLDVSYCEFGDNWFWFWWLIKLWHANIFPRSFFREHRFNKS